MADVAPPPSPPAYDTSIDSDSSHISADNKAEGTETVQPISACWHRSARAEWQDHDGQNHSLPDLALSLCYCPTANTTFFKLQTRVDLEGCKHYHFYLHLAPERIRSLAPASPTSTQDDGPNTRCLRFEMTQPSVLVAPSWPCRPKNTQSETTLQLLQSLGQASVFTIVVSIPLRTISDASLRSLSAALTRQSLKADPDQANVRRYYRGQGGIAVDLNDPPSDKAQKGKQPQCFSASAATSDVPPSYNQAVTDASSPDPLTCSPPNKKRRLDNNVPGQDDPSTQSSAKSMRGDWKQLAPENPQLSLFRSMFEHFEKTVMGLREENRELRQAVSEVADLRATITALNSKVESLERRLDADSEELERRVDGVEDGVTSLEAWTEDHEYDADQVKDLVREVFEEDFDNVSDRLIDNIIGRLRGGP
ncbi:hypothetical protein PG985_008020 [Apiospora marii]|uniref:Uncharacterized protein n=1 Tax=Apiospora marii TaxID=335849 RepID=A0ABR1R9C5_9PEZI